MNEQRRRHIHTHTHTHTTHPSINNSNTPFCMHVFLSCFRRAWRGLIQTKLVSTYTTFSVSVFLQLARSFHSLSFAFLLTDISTPSAINQSRKGKLGGAGLLLFVTYISFLKDFMSFLSFFFFFSFFNSYDLTDGR